MRMRRRVLTVVPLALFVLLAQGCDDDATGPAMATLTAELTMTGNAPDPDGATVSVDGGAEQVLFAGHAVELGEVEAGSHVVTLGGLADNCQVAGENPRMVSVDGGRDATVSFEVACSTPVDDGTVTWDWLQSVGLYEEGEPQADTVPGETKLEERVDGTWMCTVKRVSMDQYPDDYATFNPNAEVIYPGSMLQGATLVDATPEPVVVERAGGTVVINLVNGSGGTYQQVDEVKQSTIIQAINDILAENTGTGAARLTFTSSEVQSHQEMAAALGVNVSTLGSSFRSSLGFSTDRDYNRFLVKLTQSYYTVSFDLPLGLGDLFAPSVTVDDLEPYVGPGNPPTYISSVTYGRSFFLLVESTASSTDMRASINASYRAVAVKADVATDFTYVNDLENVNIKVFALGGDPGLAAANFNGDIGALGEFLIDGADINTGVPLSYVVRNVLDNSIVSVKVATDYDIKSCVPVLSEQLQSTFDEPTQGVAGWVSYDNGSTAISYHDGSVAGQCSDGGCISQRDGTDGRMQFRAPIEWRDGKSWLPFYGGTISYYAQSDGGDDVVPASRTEGIVIQGPNGRISADIPTFMVHEIRVGWTPLSFVLDENGTTFTLGANTALVKWLDASGQEATGQYIQDVLANVTDFRILGDMVYGSDRTYLDSIEVMPPETGGVGIGF